MSRLTFVENNYEDCSMSDDEVENTENSEKERKHKLQMNPINSKVLSPWLDRFLSSRRDNEIGDQFDIYACNEPVFFEEFSSRFTRTSVSKAETKNDCLIDDVENEKIKFAIQKIPYESPIEKLVFKLFNLPWSMSSDQILHCASNLGVTFLSVSVEVNKKTLRPAGTAMAEAEASTDATCIIKALEDKDFHGRPLGIRLFENRSKSGKQGDTGRYFSDDISCKCYLCGKVGHKQADCTNPPLPLPCHLCAGSDHESSNCPNITCYRCGEFGHQLRTCNNHRFTRVCICTACGYNTHETRNCPLDAAKKSDYLKRLEHAKVQCMVCKEPGHSLCKPVLPSGSQMIQGRQLYCFNCGLEGHNIDMKDSLPDEETGAVVCTHPRIEAYSKVNVLMSSLELPVDRQQEAYLKAARSSNMPPDVLAHLFPCLPKPKPPSSEQNRFAGTNAGYIPQNDVRKFIADLPYHDQLFRGRQGIGDRTNTWSAPRESAYGSGRSVSDGARQDHSRVQSLPPRPYGELPRPVSARPIIESGYRYVEESRFRRSEPEPPRLFAAHHSGEARSDARWAIPQPQQSLNPYTQVPRISFNHSGSSRSYQESQPSALSFSDHRLQADFLNSSHKRYAADLTAGDSSKRLRNFK